MVVEQAQIDIRAAREDDLAKIIALVDSHDEDDAEAIRDSLTENQFQNHFVATLNQEVVGITGYEQQLDCDKTFYLSWTYVHDDHCGKGIGKQLMTYIIDEFKRHHARKVFVKISDYVDPEDGPIYETAMALYKKFGFEEEVVLNDYYDTDESMHILGLRINEDYDPAPNKPEKPNLKFDGLYLISETEHSYSFSWKTTSWWKGSFSVQDVQIGLDAAYDDEAHQVFLSFPSTFERACQIVEAAGFKFVGELKDYYEDGINELHFVYDFRKNQN